MIKAYSIDLRERAVALLDEGATSLEVAELLDVSDSWVRKMRLLEAVGADERAELCGEEMMADIDELEATLGRV